MKPILSLLILMLLLSATNLSTAQAPQSFKYQSVARNATGLPIASANIGLRISIRDLSANGTVIYRETHTAATNAFGVFTIAVGSGAAQTGTFSAIAWGSGAKYLSIEADFAGGTAYVSMGTSELLSVPYALYSQNGTPGPQGPAGLTGAPGPQGSTGSIGPQGPAGVQGAVGPAGPKGDDGIGVQGPAGAQGLQGNSGPKGDPGQDGAPGANGISLSWLGALSAAPASPSINQAYYNSTDKTSYVYDGSAWSIIATDGATGLQGPAGVQGLQGPSGFIGPKGDPGSSLTWLGTMSGEPASASLNQAYYNSTDKASYVYDGSSWSLVAVDGAVGAQGLQGLNGAIGPKGDPGNSLSWLGELSIAPSSPTMNQAYYNSTDGKSYVYNGSTWSTLAQNGAIGPQGVQGLTGLTGANGPQGPQGMLPNGTVAGSLPFWGGSSWQLNSTKIINNGGTIGIGTTTPWSGASLEIAGQLRINNGAQGVGKVLTSDVNGIATWASPAPAGWGLTGNGGTDAATNFIGTTTNVSLNFRVNGVKAGKLDTNGAVFLGFNAGQTNGNTNSVGVGQNSLSSNTTGYENMGIGANTLLANTTGTQNTAGGSDALRDNSTGSVNTAVGWASMLFSTTGGYNTSIGARTLIANSTGSYNTAVGYQAGITGNFSNANTTGSNNTFVGYNSGPGTSTPLTNATSIGYNALVSASNSLVLGGTGADAVKVGIGVTVPAAFLDVAGNVKITDGTQGPGKVLTSDANGLAAWATPTSGGWGLSGTSGTVDGTNFIGTTDDVPLNFRVNNEQAGRIDITPRNTFFGYQSGRINTTGNHNTAAGHYTLYFNTGGMGNTANGTFALTANSTGNFNTATGYNALTLNTTGDSNTAYGVEALVSNTTGANNTAEGRNALYSNTTGGGNTATGSNVLFSNTTGVGNVAHGNGTLASNTTGNFNTALGTGADVTTSALENATAIGYNAKVSTSNSLVLGGTGTEAVKVGIGVTAPAAFLDVAGNIKITDGTQGLGKVLTSDANGVATWATPGGGGGWGLSGTSGTTDGTNFIGTIDNVPLNFKVNSQKAGRIDPTLVNTFFGHTAGNATSTGNNNSALGSAALLNNTTGMNNTATGSAALRTNISGSDNTATGFGALQNNVTSSNTAFGSNALNLNTTGNSNTAMGTFALKSNTTASENSAFGLFALLNNTSGSDNTGIGVRALSANTIGGNNTGTGAYALYSNTSGGTNTAHGASSLQNNANGNSNTAVGQASLYQNVSGSSNTAVGQNAFFSGTAFSNSTAIGFNSQVTASNMIRLGDANVTSINGAVAFTVVSDGRFKKDIRENVSGLQFIMKLRPVTYHFDMNEMARFMKTPDSLRVAESEKQKELVLQTGFIAQEVEKAAREVGYDFSGVDKPNSDEAYYGLRYAEFTVPLVKAVQEQQKMIDDLRAEIETMKAQHQSTVKTLTDKNNRLQSDLETRLRKMEETLGVKAQK